MKRFGLLLVRIGLVSAITTTCGFKLGKSSSKAKNQDSAAHLSLVSVKNLPKDLDKEKTYSLEFEYQPQFEVWISLAGDLANQADFDCVKKSESLEWKRLTGKQYSLSGLSEGKNFLCGRVKQNEVIVETRQIAKWVQDSVAPDPSVSGFPSVPDGPKEISLTPNNASDWVKFQMIEGGERSFDCNESAMGLDWVPWQAKSIIKLPAKPLGGTRLFCIKSQDAAGNQSEWFKTQWNETTVPLPFAINGLPNGGVISTLTLILQLSPEHKGEFHWVTSPFTVCRMDQAQKVAVSQDPVAIQISFAKDGLNRLCISYQEDSSKPVVVGVYEYWVETPGSVARVSGLPSVPYTNQQKSILSIDQSKYPGEWIAAKVVAQTSECSSLSFQGSDFQTATELDLGADGPKVICYQIKYLNGLTGPIKNHEFIKDTQEPAPNIELKAGANLIWSKLSSSLSVTSPTSVPYETAPNPLAMAVAVVESTSNCPTISQIGSSSDWVVSNVTEFKHKNLNLLSGEKSYKICISVRDRASNWSAVGVSQEVNFIFSPFQSPSTRNINLNNSFSNPTQASRIELVPSGLMPQEKIVYHLTRQSSLSCPTTPVIVPSLTNACSPCPSYDQLATLWVDALEIDQKPNLDLNVDGLYRVCLAIKDETNSYSLAGKSLQLIKDASVASAIVTFPIAEGSDTLANTNLLLTVTNPVEATLPTELLTKYLYLLYEEENFFETNIACPVPGTTGGVYLGAGTLPVGATARSLAPIALNQNTFINAPIHAPIQKPWKRLCVVGITDQGLYSAPVRRLWSLTQGDPAGLPKTTVLLPSLTNLAAQRNLPFVDLKIQDARRYSFVLYNGEQPCPSFDSPLYPTTLKNGYEKLDVTLNMLKAVGGVHGPKTLCVRGKNDANPTAVVYRLVWTQLYSLEPEPTTQLPANGNTQTLLTFKIQHSALRPGANQYPKVDVLFSIESSDLSFSNASHCKSKVNPLLNPTNLTRVPFLSTSSTVNPLTTQGLLYDGNASDVAGQGKIRTFNASIPNGATNKVICVWGRDQVGNLLEPFQHSWIQGPVN